tara:strand:- start:30219 stop:32312 length:2094 start_codon:yes stop_codon:yes gene_type:complete
LVGSAFAQEISDPEDEVSTLDTVIVSARKRDESLKDVPGSLAVVSAEQIEAKSAVGLSDLTLSIPNVSYQDRGSGFNSFSIRGISSNARNTGIEDSVSIYVDGVYVGRPAFFDLNLADVQSVEVLRGPQGTLFGKNTIAGAINIVTPKPKLGEFFGRGTIGYGEFDAISAKGFVNVPVSSSIAAKLSISTRQRDGYIDNLTDGRVFQGLDEQSARGQILFDSGEALTVLLSADYTNKDNDINISQVLRPSGSFAALFGAQAGPLVTEEDGPNFDKQEFGGVSATFEYTLPSDHTLKAVAAYRDMTVKTGSDDDNTGVNLISSIVDDHTDQTSLELLLSSPGSSEFRYVAGVYYLNQETDSMRRTGALPALTDITGDGGNTTVSYAVYGNADWDITDKLTVGAGARWSRDDKEAAWLQTTAGLPATLGLQGIQIADDRSFEKVTPSVNISYDLSSEITGYALWSKGYKSGSFMTDIFEPAVDPVSEFVLLPETVDNYEVGLKGSAWNNRFRFNFAAFSMDYKDLQVINLNAIGFIGSNAGAATIEGIELETDTRLTDSLTVSLNAGYLDAYYDELFQEGSDLSGNRMRNAPEWTGTASVNYRPTIQGIGEFDAWLDVNYRGGIFFDPQNRPSSHQPAITVVNGRIGLLPEGQDWSIYIWGRNLFDKEYTTFLRFGPFGQEQGSFAPPRTYGIEATLNF